VLRRIAIAALWCATTLAQPQSPPAFDVVSIKHRTVIGQRRGLDAPNESIDPGMVSLSVASAGELVEFAYDCKSPQQVVGRPNWDGREFYDVVAKSALPATRQQQRAMMQTMLADRFRLACHRETRQVAGYALVRGGKLRLIPTQDAPGEFEPPRPLHSMRGSELIFTYTGMLTMTQLADWLWRRFHQPVADQTGLTGAFEFSMAMTNEQAMGFDDFTLAVQQQLGIAVKPRRVPMEVIVIDRMERPSEN